MKTKTVHVRGVRIRVTVPNSRILSMSDWSVLDAWIQDGTIRESRRAVTNNVSVYDWFLTAH